MQKLERRKERKEFISIIIPAYNESGRILPTLNRIDEYFKDRFKCFEIIVVNDGSTDNIDDLVLKANERTAYIKYLGYNVNKGKGYAIRQGVNISAGDIIVVSDADLSTPIEDVEKLLVQYDNGYDIIIGSRALEESDIVVRQPWWRVLMGKIFNRFVRFLLLEEFKDTQCGFKLFKGDIGRKIFKHATVDRFAFDVEILCLAKKAGYRIKEVPIRWVNSPDSKVKPIKDSLQMLKDLVKIRFRKV
jgi:dolichyl-phosphate beta-glucosyltransferase